MEEGPTVGMVGEEKCHRYSDPHPFISFPHIDVKQLRWKFDLSKWTKSKFSHYWKAELNYLEIWELQMHSVEIS